MEKALYINNGESFSINNLIELLNLIDKNGKIIYIWYRNWWLNKAEEIDSLQKQLNKQAVNTAYLFIYNDFALIYINMIKLVNELLIKGEKDEFNNS